MTRPIFKHGMPAATLSISIPTTAAAQDTAGTPEGVTWLLTAYADDAMASVPFFVQATLRLQDGAATSSTGCDTFDGRYVLDGPGLTFSEAFALTRAACPDEARQRVESGYLATLPEVITSPGASNRRLRPAAPSPTAVSRSRWSLRRKAV